MNIIQDGDARTLIQNILCLLIFILHLVCSYLGYLYKNALEDKGAEDGLVPNADLNRESFANPYGYSNPNRNDNPNPYLYNGGGTGLASNNNNNDRN